MDKKGEGHTALYRKYRPRSLDELVGQSHVTDILSRSLKQGKVAHAYLLTGPRGVGKTSIARILAHEINGLSYGAEDSHLDIIEIDAASNNGVDDVRDLRDKVMIAPSSAQRKIYIIDEVHMLSKAAFNALLKTLEEPPAHVVFILATTDLHKVPATIISRTQHFAFHSISPEDLAKHLRTIADAEGLKISDDALMTIAGRGGGSFRDSISLLDQLSSFADDNDGVTSELVESLLGLASTDAVENLLAAVMANDIAGVIAQLDALERHGIQPTVLADQIITSVRAKLADQPQLVTLMDALLDVSGSSQPQLKLLTTLVSAVKPKTAAAVATRSAVQPKPVVIEAPIQILPAEEMIPQKKPAQTVVPPQKEQANEKAEQTAAEATEPVVTSPKKAGPNPDTLDWKALTDYTREKLVALHSVLAKCSYELDGATLTLYTGRKFNKTKLDEAKYLTQLFEALEHVGFSGLTIVTIPTAKPPEDEKLAGIAAMMGGGQEVELTEDTANG